MGTLGCLGTTGRNRHRTFAFQAAPDGSGDPAFYLKRADECRRAAQSASDGETRDVWLQLANQWMHLVLHADRRARDAQLGRRGRDHGAGNA